MYLKALTIKGFKSFADPVSMRFEPGITVVVGPNGSGKSNVVDAVAWVLGAQGPRTLRSSKMEDVIFAGSADRPTLGRAEVSLTIDNRAGRLPGGLAEVTITRTLFRSGESEYAINSEPCRLLDVQELLSDSGVGRTQHVIVGQGQLDQILNARPEDRRAVVEEAAGVLKHRRRRERAERRLAATEDNLERLGDLVREVRRQIRPLERQAAAARSYNTLAEELTALSVHLAGREISQLDARRVQVSSERDLLETREEDLRLKLAELEAATDRATADLSSRRDEHLVAALTRVRELAERCRGLKGILNERGRSLGRALDEALDADVVANLEAEAARLASDLEEVAAATSAMEPDARRADAAELRLEQELSAHEASYGDMSELRRAEEAFLLERTRADAIRQALARDETNLDLADEQVESGRERLSAIEEEAEGVEVRLAKVEESLTALSLAAQETETLRHAAAEEALAAEETLRRAETQKHRLEARSESLERAVADARGESGAEVLKGLPGMLGLLGDLVDVEDGWGAAFEAAIGAALSASVVEGTEPPRVALGRLRARRAAGSVLSLAAISRRATDRSGTAWSPGAGLPPGADPVRVHVRGRTGGVEAALDQLLADAVAVEGWEDAIDLALRRPELVVVSREGDRLSSAGWHVAGVDGGGAAAAREAKRVADEAAGAADRSLASAEAARRRATEAADSALAARREAERAEDAERSLQAERRRLGSQLASLREEHERRVGHRSSITERVASDRASLEEVDRGLLRMEATAATAASRLAQGSEARRVLDERRAEISGVRRELDLRYASLAERRAVLGDRLADVERRLAGHEAQRLEAAERRSRLQNQLKAIESLSRLVDARSEELASIGARLQSERDRQLEELRAGGARLDSLRQARGDLESRSGAGRDELRRLDAELASIDVKREAAVESLQHDFGCSAEQAVAQPRPDLPEGIGPEERASALDKELASLGPVNPLALEELSALEERHGFLDRQIEDVRRARRELHQVIAAVDEEVSRLFAEAFAEVNEHFQNLVSSLFPGGTGRLSLTAPEDLLNTGIDVQARPAGKNIRQLALLSGGERSLVALAFLFAVFKSRPSPFYLMDEVEAALDDVNLHRFLDLLHEFREDAQLIIVSHQKRTMEAADALYGVTMQPGGSSKVVSQKVSAQPPSDPEPAATSS